VKTQGTAGAARAVPNVLADEPRRSRGNTRSQDGRELSPSGSPRQAGGTPGTYFLSEEYLPSRLTPKPICHHLTPTHRPLPCSLLAYFTSMLSRTALLPPAIAAAAS
jgi:hypothetical protein